jgi:ADP-ribose pyrophosphatase YjhB (NUDIX family)
MQWSPHVTVAAVVERNGRFLLVEEVADGRRVLNQPAGHLEAEETLLAAVIREVREETCRHFTPAQLIGVYRWRRYPGTATILRFCLSGTVSEIDSALQQDPDIHAQHWLSPVELAAAEVQPRSPLVQACIQDYRAGRAYPLELLRDLADGP